MNEGAEIFALAVTPNQMEMWKAVAAFCFFSLFFLLFSHAGWINQGEKEKCCAIRKPALGISWISPFQVLHHFLNSTQFWHERCALHQFISNCNRSKFPWHYIIAIWVSLFCFCCFFFFFLFSRHCARVPQGFSMSLCKSLEKFNHFQD